MLLIALCVGGFYFWQQNQKQKAALEKQRLADAEKARQLGAERQRQQEQLRLASATLAKAEAYYETGKLDEASGLLVTRVVIPSPHANLLEVLSP